MKIGQPDTHTHTKTEFKRAFDNQEFEDDTIQKQTKEMIWQGLEYH